jgi:hypothetical protein
LKTKGYFNPRFYSQIKTQAKDIFEMENKDFEIYFLVWFSVQTQAGFE